MKVFGVEVCRSIANSLSMFAFCFTCFKNIKELVMVLEIPKCPFCWILSQAQLRNLSCQAGAKSQALGHAAWVPKALNSFVAESLQVPTCSNYSSSTLIIVWLSMDMVSKSGDQLTYQLFIQVINWTWYDVVDGSCVSEKSNGLPLLSNCTVQASDSFCSLGEDAVPSVTRSLDYNPTQ